MPADGKDVNQTHLYPVRESRSILLDTASVCVLHSSASLASMLIHTWASFVTKPFFLVDCASKSGSNLFLSTLLTEKLVHSKRGCGFNLLFLPGFLPGCSVTVTSLEL